MGDTTPPPPPPPPLPGAPPPPPPPPPAPAPAAFVGYGRRSPGRSPDAGAPASMLQPQRGPQPVPQMRMTGMAPAPYPSAPRYAFERNLALLLAQLLAVVQGVLGVIGGIQEISTQLSFSALGSQIGLGINFVPVDGILAITISVLVIVAGLFVGRPSIVLRWVLVTWELVAIAFTVGVLAAFIPLLQLRDAVAVLLPSVGIGFVHPWIALAIEVAIVYGLLIHPPTRQSFI